MLECQQLEKKAVSVKYVQAYNRDLMTWRVSINTAYEMWSDEVVTIKTCITESCRSHHGMAGLPHISARPGTIVRR